MPFCRSWRRSAILVRLIIIYNAISAAALTQMGMSETEYFETHFLTDERGRRYLAPIIDGYHRLAALYISGAEITDCMFTWSNLYAVNQSKNEPDVESEGTGWDQRRIGLLIEATICELFGPESQNF